MCECMCECTCERVCASVSLHVCRCGGGVYSYVSLQSALPKAASSLKVLAELPIIVVLMYQVNQTTHLLIIP